jgi:hypothetical protein
MDVHDAVPALHQPEPFEQRSVCQREDSRVETDADCKYCDSRNAEGGAAPQSANGVAYVGSPFIDETQAGGIPALVAAGGNGPQFCMRPASCLIGWKTVTDQVLGSPFEVELKLIIHFGVQTASVGDGVDQRSEAC